jgi:uncharacterized protein YaaQ
VTGVTGKFRKVLERVSRQAIRSGDTLLLTVRTQEEVDKVMAIVREARVHLQALVPRRKTLEDHFMSYVQKREEGKG